MAENNKVFERESQVPKKLSLAQFFSSYNNDDGRRFHSRSFLPSSLEKSCIQY